MAALTSLLSSGSFVVPGGNFLARSAARVFRRSIASSLSFLVLASFSTSFSFSLPTWTWTSTRVTIVLPFCSFRRKSIIQKTVSSGLQPFVRPKFIWCLSSGVRIATSTDIGVHPFFFAAFLVVAIRVFLSILLVGFEWDTPQAAAAPTLWIIL